jgi:hypothetical protein
MWDWVGETSVSPVIPRQKFEGAVGVFGGGTPSQIGQLQNIKGDKEFHHKTLHF